MLLVLQLLLVGAWRDDVWLPWLDNTFITRSFALKVTEEGLDSEEQAQYLRVVSQHQLEGHGNIALPKGRSPCTKAISGIKIKTTACTFDNNHSST